MKLRTTEEGLDLIRHFEGLELEPYQDAAGVWTVGFGHAGRDVRPGVRITVETAERLLLKDVAEAERGVNRLVRVPLNDNQFSALTSFVFNLGATRLRGTGTMLALNQGRHMEFADRLLLWDKAGGKVLRGLTRRREAERALFLRPVLVAGNDLTATKP